MDFNNIKKGVKKIWKKFWFMFWKEDSFKGWIFSLIVLLIFFQLIFFPGLRLLTGSPLPLAIVESCSMYHEHNFFSSFDSWWERNEDKYNELGITKEEFEKFPFKRGFGKGDILLTINANPEELEIGEIILFNANQKNPVIHRIINIKETENGKIFSTIGDNNNQQLSVEKEITEKNIIAKAKVRIIPYAGWIKLIFFEPFRPVSNKGLCNEN